MVIITGTCNSVSLLQRVEERRTVEDKTGNRETTVTRKIGDQSQTITTKRSPDGSEELVETTVNLDKGKVLTLVVMCIPLTFYLIKWN